MKLTNDADVLILAAGVAGLSAARDLCVAGQRVIVIEARDRIGGRLFTRHHAGHALPIELGPEFVHGRMPDTFALLGEAGLIAYDVLEKHETTRHGKPASQASAWAQAERIVSKLDSVGRNDCSFEDFLKTRARRSPPLAKAMARQFVEGFNAAPAGDISCRSLAKANVEESKHEDGEKQYRLVGGYDRLVDALARSLREPSRIDVASVVRRVRWKRGHVEVTVSRPGGEVSYRVARAVVALPLGVLQAPVEAAGGVTFEPPLPTRDAIAHSLAMGPVVKLSIRFRTPFWEALGHKDLGFLHRADVAFPTWWSTLPLRTSVLTAWAGGPTAERLVGSDLAGHAIESLASIFSVSHAQVAKQIEQIDHHDWSADPFSRGAYSYARVGGAETPELLARPIARTLYFAGEHTHGGLLGTVAGAIHSGCRAAKAILRA